MLNPLVLGMMIILVGVVFAGWGRRRWAIGFGGGAFVWFWIWSTQMMMELFALPLETEFPVVKAEDSPTADAIVLLGGGMGANTNVYPYAEMWGGADRVWHAARLYKAGKAPLVIPSGQGEGQSSVPLLLDLGVPLAAIKVEDKARNTEENAKFVQDLLVNSSTTNSSISPSEHSNIRTFQHSKPKILLVTSAWHMRRSLLMYRRYAPGLEIVPAAADYETLVTTSSFKFSDLLPSYDRFLRNCVASKEYIGYWGYRLLRK